MGWINDGGNHLRFALLICSPVIRTVIKAVSHYGPVVMVGRAAWIFKIDLMGCLALRDFTFAQSRHPVSPSADVADADLCRRRLSSPLEPSKCQALQYFFIALRLEEGVGQTWIPQALETGWTAQVCSLMLASTASSRLHFDF